MEKSDALLLVVDDSPSVRECICDLLQDLGFTHVDQAANGAIALALFQRTPYDVVITDWYMPHVNGIELLRAIRTGSQRQDTPVLVLTGSVTSTCLRQAFAEGATGFIPKPFVARALCEKVVSLVAERMEATV